MTPTPMRLRAPRRLRAPVAIGLAALVLLAPGARALAQPADDGEPPATPADAPVVEPAAVEPTYGPATPAAAAAAAPTDDPPRGETSTVPSGPAAPRYALHGYLAPQFGATVRDGGLPRDRTEYGAGGSRAGVILEGTPLPRWSAVIHVIFDARFVDAVTDVDAVDNGQGGVSGIDTSTTRMSGVLLEEAAVTWRPHAVVAARAGRLRIPFTAQHQSGSQALLFPDRAGPSEVFLSGTDLGLLVVLTPVGELITASLGGFGGTGGSSRAADESGLRWSARVDVAPLGAFPIVEGDPTVGPLRLGFGAGVLYRSAQTYDRAGYPGAVVRDFAASGSVRATVAGVYAQAEVMRRQRTDSFSSRPEVDTGAYVQAAWTLPLDLPVVFAPALRLAWARTEELVDPRATRWIEGGLAVYPVPSDPSLLRVSLLYVSEERVTLGETARRGLLEVRLRW